MLTPLKKHFHLDDEPAPLRAPRRRPTAALPVVDDEGFALALAEDTSVAAVVGRSLTASLSVVDEEFAFPLAEDEGITQVVGRVLPVGMPPVDDESAAPILDDDAALTVAPRPVLTSVPRQADEEFVVPIEEDEDHRQPVSLRLLPTVVPSPQNEDALSPILDDSDSLHRVAPRRQLVAVPRQDDQGEEIPPPPQPQQPESGGDSWRYRLRRYLRQVRDEDIDQILTEYDLADKDFEYGFDVGVVASSLNVTVYARVLNVEVVERGNLVYFVAKFGGEPDEIHFVYTRPGENRPIVDPGFGREGSGFVELSPGVYVFTLDTTGFDGGTLEWHLWGTGEFQGSQFGAIEISYRKPQLL